MSAFQNINSTTTAGGGDTTTATNSNRLRFLIVADVDLPSAARCAEHFITQVTSHTVHGDSSKRYGHGIDGIIICGPMITERNNVNISNSSSSSDKVNSSSGTSFEDQFTSSSSSSSTAAAKTAPECTYERTAAATGDISATIAMFENIACRVLYVPHTIDPLLHFDHSNCNTNTNNSSYSNTSSSNSSSSGCNSGTPRCPLSTVYHMTPNALNVDGCVLPLTQSLYMAGYCERPNSNMTAAATGIADEECGSSSGSSRGGARDGSLSFIQSMSSAPVKVLLKALADKAAAAITPTAATNTNTTTTTPPAPAAVAAVTSIFVMTYHYASTLNQLLFCLPQEVQQAHVGLCIIPTVPIVSNANANGNGNGNGDDEDNGSEGNAAPKSSLIRLPHRSDFDGVTIISPASLRLTSQYTILELVEHGSTGSNSNGSGCDSSGGIAAAGQGSQPPKPKAKHPQGWAVVAVEQHTLPQDRM